MAKIDNVVAIRAEEPEEMTRDDRRVVFAKLSDTYVDDKTGYAPSWSDKKVASDLGVPIAWVAKVRDEMFGPIVNPHEAELKAMIEEARDIRTQASNMLHEAGKVLSEAKGAISDSEAASSRISERIRSLSARLAAVEKALG